MELECVVLCVENVPLHFTKTDIFNIFEKYGKIIKYGYFKSIASTIYVEYDLKSDTMIALDDEHYLAQKYGITVSIRIRSYRKRLSQQHGNQMNLTANGNNPWTLANANNSKVVHKKFVDRNDYEQSEIKSCEFCDSFYCTNDCFTKKWVEKHTIEKELDPKLDQEEKIQMLNEINILNGSTVYITHNTDYKRCYVRSAAKDEDLQYCKYLKSVDKHSKNAKYLDSAPKVGCIVAAPYYDRYYRAQVLNVNSETGQVQTKFLDFGNKIITKWTELKHLNKKLQEQRLMVTKILLKDISKMPSNVTRSCQKLLKSLTVNNTELVIFYGTNQNSNHLKCELYAAQSGDSINDQLNRLGEIKNKKLGENDLILLF